MKVPRLGIKLKLQLPATATATASAIRDLNRICTLHHISRQCRILNPLIEARGRIGAVAAGIRYSHSNAGSEPSLGPTPQLMAPPDP